MRGKRVGQQQIRKSGMKRERSGEGSERMQAEETVREKVPGWDRGAGALLEGTREAAGSERRRYRRIPAELPMRVTVPERRGGGTECMEVTTTINVSPGDAFFLSGLHEKLEIGTEVTLAIELPVPSANLFTGKHLQVKGLVIRLGSVDTEDPSRRGVAVRFQKSPRFISSIE